MMNIYIMTNARHEVSKQLTQAARSLSLEIGWYF